MGGYQARRLVTKVKRADGTVDFVHMNDATLVASPRMLAVLIENYQMADGSIRVPRVLQEYVGKEVIQKA
ncbi:MAG: seryl-tRNA synthetase, seryl-tRNA synthetase, partial [Candidatus Parcubacteria bacterium]|jgi:seryl-tRNA synthetase